MLERGEAGSVLPCCTNGCVALYVFPWHNVFLNLETAFSVFLLSFPCISAIVMFTFFTITFCDILPSLTVHSSIYTLSDSIRC